MGVILMPTDNSNFAPGTQPVVIENTVSKTGFSTFWASRGSAAVNCPYVAIGR
jgi:hypothetical protein